MPEKSNRITQSMSFSHLESLPLRQIVNELAELDTDHAAMAIGDPDNPTCAVVIIRGRGINQYLSALERYWKEKSVPTPTKEQKSHAFIDRAKSRGWKFSEAPCPHCLAINEFMNPKNPGDVFDSCRECIACQEIFYFRCYYSGRVTVYPFKGEPA